MNRYHIPISMVASRSKVRYNHSGIKVKGQIDTISVGYCIINSTKVCLLSVEKLQLKTHLIQLNVGKALTWKLLQQLRLINKIYVSRKWYVHTHRLPSENPGYEVAYVALYSGWGGARVQPTLQVARFLISRCMSPIPKHCHIW